MGTRFKQKKKVTGDWKLGVRDAGESLGHTEWVSPPWVCYRSPRMRLPENTDEHHPAVGNKQDNRTQQTRWLDPVGGARVGAENTENLCCVFASRSRTVCMRNFFAIHVTFIQLLSVDAIVKVRDLRW